MDVIGVTSQVILYVLLTVAVIMDFTSMRVSNRLILLGLGVSFLLRIWGNGVESVVWYLSDIAFPVILLYLLYLMGAVGAGDVKLLSVVGGFLKFRLLIEVVVVAFVVAALVFFTQICLQRQLLKKLSGLVIVVRNVGMGVTKPGELAGLGERKHFTWAILAAVFIVELYHWSI